MLQGQKYSQYNHKLSACKMSFLKLSTVKKNLLMKYVELLTIILQTFLNKPLFKMGIFSIKTEPILN